MPKFFISPDEISGDTVLLQGENFSHIVKSLRMREGETFVLCDGRGRDYHCVLSRVDAAVAQAQIQQELPSTGEAVVDATLFMALPKSDKLDFIVQKSVELGANQIVVFKSSRCIPSPDPKAAEKRLLRLKRIAAEAAGQSLRGRIPEVRGVLSYKDMLKEAARADMPLFFYEAGGTSLRALLDGKPYRSASLVIGPEGGFSPEEHQMAADAGLYTASLGTRIQRCETAALSSLAALMFHAGEY